MATKRVASTAKKAAPAKKSAPSKSASSKKAPASKAPAAKKAPAKKAPAKAPATKAPASKKAAPAKKPATAAAKKAPAAATTASSSSKKASVKQPNSSGASTPAKSPFDEKFLEGQRAALLEERETLSKQAVALKEEADALARDREPGDVQFDDESGEDDTLAVERDFDLARAAAALATIEEIDAALVRIDKGTYGICEYSGQTIPKERLRAIPYARERVEFKTRSFR